MDKGYQRLFGKISRAPKFKSKKNDKPSFSARAECMYFKDPMHVNIEKIGKIKCKTDFVFPIGRSVAKFSNPRISYKNGKMDVGIWHGAREPSARIDRSNNGYRLRNKRPCDSRIKWRKNRLP